MKKTFLIACTVIAGSVLSLGLVRSQALGQQSDSISVSLIAKEKQKWDPSRLNLGSPFRRIRR